MMRFSFKRLAFLVLGLYFLVTCYTGYMVVKRKLEKAGIGIDLKKEVHNHGHNKVLADDKDWNPWGQEFEKEHQKLPIFERPHLVLDLDNANLTQSKEKSIQRKGQTEKQEPEHIVEIWGKASIGLYLWEHILQGALEPKLGGIWSYGSLTLDNIQFRFRTGYGVVLGRVPHNTANLVLVINGRSEEKIQFATTWLDSLKDLKQLRNVAVVLLGDEKCNNQWLHKYMSKHGGPVKMTFLVYDSPEVDDENFYQWPLGVATYRDFPVVKPGEISAQAARTYTCNFMGSLYPNSSRNVLLQYLHSSYQQSFCYIRARQKWVPKETDESREEYIHALKQSDLTLNPVGHNTECYRIYEAMSLGSLPVVEDIMTPGHCGGSVPYPLRLLKQYQAPVIYVSNWSMVNQLLESEQHRSASDIANRREKLLTWYSNFLEKLKWRFVAIIKKKFFSEST